MRDRVHKENYSVDIIYDIEASVDLLRADRGFVGFWTPPPSFESKNRSRFCRTSLRCVVRGVSTPRGDVAMTTSRLMTGSSGP